MALPGAPDKAAGAFRTIGELSRETGLPQHILRYWETRFPELRPLQRAGNRRYYRPTDVALVLRIRSLLEHEGYTIRGVQKLLVAERKRSATGQPKAERAPDAQPTQFDAQALQQVRDDLVSALAEDAE